MFQVVLPWVFVLLPLPWLVRIILPRKEESKEAALHVPYIEDFQLDSKIKTKTKKRWPIFIYTIIWLLLLIASSRPQWIGDPIELPVSGRDIMIAIDLSDSMNQRFNYSYRSSSKLDATKSVASEFIDKRIGDRIGLILFGEQAYVQTPLTFDRATVITLLSEAVPGLAGRSTAIGDAIGLAVKRLSKESEQQVLILLTDGVSTSGEIKPEKAAELAASKGLKIHTIGVGSRKSRELDETTLKSIAKKTGGQYFRAHDINELQNIYQLIDQLEPVEKETQSYQPTWSLFYWPLVAAIILASFLVTFRLKGWA